MEFPKEKSVNPEQSTSGAEAKMPPDYMEILIFDGRVVIHDYSKNDDRELVLVLLGAFGIKTENVSEGWCG